MLKSAVIKEYIFQSRIIKEYVFWEMKLMNITLTSSSNEDCKSWTECCEK